jgi:monoamine oxidase
VPPRLAGRIAYDPILPFERDQLTQRYGQGTLTKVAAVYERPFWREQGLTGFAVDTGFPISIAYDDSPPGAGPGWCSDSWGVITRAATPACRPVRAGPL